MKTLLTNSKMPPDLRSRIERSLGRAPSRAQLRPSAIAALRVVTVTVILACVAWFGVQYHRRQAELDAARAQLLNTLSVHAARLSGSSRELIPTLERWLAQASGGPRITTPSATRLMNSGKPAGYCHGRTVRLLTVIERTPK